MANLFEGMKIHNVRLKGRHLCLLSLSNLIHVNLHYFGRSTACHSISDTCHSHIWPAVPLACFPMLDLRNAGDTTGNSETRGCGLLDRYLFLGRKMTEEFRDVED